MRLSIEPAVYQSHAFKIENIKEALPGESIIHPLEQNILGQKPHLGSQAQAGCPQLYR